MTQQKHYQNQVHETLIAAREFESALKALSQISSNHIEQYDIQRLYLALTLITDHIEGLYAKS